MVVCLFGFIKGLDVLVFWFLNPNTLGKAELEKVSEIIEQWRERLYDIGWFMRCVNEKIARMEKGLHGCRSYGFCRSKNPYEEDNVTGRFYKRLLPFTLRAS